MRRILCSTTLAMLILCAGRTCLSQEEKKAFTDPVEAGMDYSGQGEFVGEMTLANGTKQKVGLQVIAQGGGAWQNVAFVGGLPGDGATARKEVRDVFGDVRTYRQNNGTLSLLDREGNELCKLTKVQRESPTLGMKPPEEAKVLFDGTSAENFNGGKMTDDHLLMVGCTSKQSFRDFTLHMEFRTPFMPYARGQGRGNSGVYLQDRYELQILDSFGLKGLNNECGGFYSLRDPDVNMCLPPLAWQTYDIDFQAAQFDEKGAKTKNAVVTVKHNGIVVHDAYELPGPTPAGKPETSQPGPFQLQNHGNPVHFRNIWVVEK